MFSVIFPGQGSQTVGMCKEFHAKYDLAKKLFKQADDNLKFSISELILNGPKEKLDLTENTQPAIFLVGYTIYKVLKNEHSIDLNKAEFFAGHSLGEYTAIACANGLDFSETLKILQIRGRAMQSAVPPGEGGMIAVLGKDIIDIENMLNENKKSYDCFIANDNSAGQIVVSGKKSDVDKFSIDLQKSKIKNIKLAVSAPFHCKLMNKATEIMINELDKLNFSKLSNHIVSNVTADIIIDTNHLKKLLTQQIESRVRWRESVLYMIKMGVKNFIEIGPGKVLSGLIKRIDKKVNVNSINCENDINNINLNDKL